MVAVLNFVAARSSHVESARECAWVSRCVGMADTATSEHPDAFHTSTESPATGGEQEPQDDLTRILVLLNTMRATVRFHHVRARVASRVGARAS